RQGPDCCLEGQATTAPRRAWDPHRLDPGKPLRRRGEVRALTHQARGPSSILCCLYRNVPWARSGGKRMSRSLLLAVTCLVAPWAALLPLTLRAEEPTAPKILASASDPNPVLVRLKKEDSSVVIRSAEELVAHSSKPDSAKDPAAQKAAEAELVKRLNVESID